MCYDRDCSKKYSERNGRNSKNTAVRLESGMDAVKRLQSEKEENERLTYKEIIKNKEINAYLKKETKTWDSWNIRIIRRNTVCRLSIRQENF